MLIAKAVGCGSSFRKLEGCCAKKGKGVCWLCFPHFVGRNSIIKCKNGIHPYLFTNEFKIEGYTATYSANNFSSDLFINYYLLKNNHHLLSLGTGVGLTYSEERDFRLNGLDTFRNTIAMYENDYLGLNFALFKVNYTYLINENIGIQANTNFSIYNEYFAVGIGIKTMF
jgi:hypothetical protein